MRLASTSWAILTECGSIQTRIKCQYQISPSFLDQRSSERLQRMHQILFKICSISTRLLRLSLSTIAISSSRQKRSRMTRGRRSLRNHLQPSTKPIRSSKRTQVSQTRHQAGATLTTQSSSSKCNCCMFTQSLGHFFYVLYCCIGSTEAVYQRCSETQASHLNSHAFFALG